MTWQTADGALAGIRVVDLSVEAPEQLDALSQVVCALLAGAGAEVVRVPRGAESDWADTPPELRCRGLRGHGRWAHAAADDLPRLLGTADVVLTRDAAVGDAIGESVVVAVVESDSGADGRPLPPHELVAQALTGACRELVAGRPAYDGFRFGTYGAGINLATAIVAALVERFDTGIGGRLSVSMAAGVESYLAMLWTGGGDAVPVGADIPLFECADGELVCLSISPRSPDVLGSLAVALDYVGAPQELRGTRDPADPARYFYDPGTVGPAFRRWTSTEILDRLRREDFAVETVGRPTAAFDRPEVRHSGLVFRCGDCGSEYVGSPVTGGPR